MTKFTVGGSGQQSKGKGDPDAYAYYEEIGTANPDAEVLIVCPDCNDSFQRPQGYGKARIHDKGQYGQAVPHLHCDECGKKVTN